MLNLDLTFYDAKCRTACHPSFTEDCWYSLVKKDTSHKTFVNMFLVRDEGGNIV